MRIWDYRLLPYLPDAQFKGQLREMVAIMHAIFAALAFESGNEENTVVEYILPEVYEKFRMMMAIEKFAARGYMEWDKTQKDEDGFPAIKIIVPPNEWDMSEEA